MRNKTIFYIAAIVLSVFALCFSMPAYADEYVDSNTETLIVNAAWLDGEMLHIDVTDPQTGDNSSLSINLTEYIKETDNSEYISVQAVDLDGNKSGIIQLKNPFYKPVINENSETQDETTQSAVPNGANAFTPDGTGTVMDNATDGDGKEFFTITTDDDNVFYLIIDRQRNSNNVYLLNAVTEEDLKNLSKKIENNSNDGTSSAIPTPDDTPTETKPTTTETEPEQETPPPENKSSTGTIIFIGIAVLIFGAAGYYFKIYKPKKEAPAPEEDDEDMEYEDEPEEAESNDDEYKDRIDSEYGDDNE